MPLGLFDFEKHADALLVRSRSMLTQQRCPACRRAHSYNHHSLDTPPLCWLGVRLQRGRVSASRVILPRWQYGRRRSTASSSVGRLTQTNSLGHSNQSLAWCRPPIRPLSIITQSEADHRASRSLLNGVLDRPGEPAAWTSAIHYVRWMHAGDDSELQQLAAPLRTRCKRQIERCKVRLDAGNGRGPSGAMFLDSPTARPAMIPVSLSAGQIMFPTQLLAARLCPLIRV